MPRLCSVCSHPESFAINEAIIGIGEQGKLSYQEISRRYGLDDSAVHRHTAHIPQLLLKAKEGMEAYDAAAILARIRDLELETLEQLEAAKEDADRKHVLAAIREQRANLELVSRIARLISDAPQVNVLIAPHVQALIFSALEPYPEARVAVSSALAELEAS
jgi:hypothetical protein